MLVLGKEVPTRDGLMDLNFIANLLDVPESRTPQMWAYALPSFSAEEIRIIGQTVWVNQEYCHKYLDSLLPRALTQKQRREQCLNGGILELEGDIWVWATCIHGVKDNYFLKDIEQIPGITLNPQESIWPKQIGKSEEWVNKSMLYTLLYVGLPELRDALILSKKVRVINVPDHLKERIKE